MQGIYTVVNNINNKIYVGSAVNINRRWARHKRDLNNGRHHNIHLQRAWTKYGSDVFSFSIVENVDDESLLLEREQHYMNITNACDCNIGYNIAVNAGSSLGIKRSDEFKNKIRLANLGRIESNKTREKKRISALGNPKYSRIQNKGGDSTRARQIIQYTKTGEYINTWSSIAEAVEAVGVKTHANISSCCNGRIKSAYGYVWKYVEVA